MNRSKTRNPQWQRRLIHPPRAVIDIGSNTVRLVIYAGTGRAPETVWNEKVSARLGRDLSDSGRIPGEAAEEALAALARYELLVRDRGIVDIQTVATAAARDAENGREFLDKVAALGLEPRLLSEEEEAFASAYGVIGAFPGAEGISADLGGGSLELVSLGDGRCHEAVSLPFGTLRLPALRTADPSLDSTIHDRLDQIPWVKRQSGPLYMIGGTWRALAHYAMVEADYPLTDPHGFMLSVSEARQHARTLVDADADELVKISGISQMRAEYLPDAAAMLLPLLDVIEPDHLVFSSWGIREGLLYSRLSDLQCALDPLLAGVHAFAEPRDAPVVDAARVVGWTVDLANGKGKRNERLRLAAAQLAAALQRVEPNLRLTHATEWSLDKRWIDCSPRDRAMMCAALFGSLGRTELPGKLELLADGDDLREGLTWGLGFRLARRLGAGARTALSFSKLRLKKKSLVLYLDESRAALATYPLTRDLDILAEWLGRTAKIKIGEFNFTDTIEEEEEE
ncbi:Ppx/GppA family phosphatase [Qipengyuania sp. NPDC077563]|uniref:Ppx/GppA phosphatase family protein n=1 Tax=Qipengyuania sp. NPDC077563 TaxID=3364497 RepID=UPI00384F09FD